MFKKSLVGINKILSWIVLLTFLSTNVSAAPLSQSSLHFDGVKIPSLANDIDIPGSLGSVDKRVASSGPTIIHIQDAHSSMEGQHRIKEILNHLVEKHKVDLIFLEGAIEPLDVDLLRFFKDESQNQELAERLLEKGVIGGAELFMLERPQGRVSVYDIEDPVLYKENLRAFRNVFKHKSVSDLSLRRMKSKLLTESSLQLNKTLRSFFKEWIYYQDAQKQLLAHIDTLQKYSRRYLNLDFTDARQQIEWPQQVRFFKLRKLEAEMNPKKLEEEKQALLQWLEDSKLSGKEVDQFKQLLMEEIKESNFIPRHVVEIFYEKSSHQGFSFKNYPEVSNHLGHEIIRSEIDAVSLYQELDHATELLFDKLAKTDVEKEIISRYRDYLLLSKLFSLQLTFEEFGQVLEHKEAFRSLAGPKLDRLFQESLDFYQSAQAREQVMCEKMISKMKDLKKNHAVLITGGFHSAGLKELFQKNSLSYVEISPRLSEISEDKTYVNVMMLQGIAMPERSSMRQLTVANKIGTIETQIGRAEAKYYAGALLGSIRDVAQIPELQIEAANSIAAQKHGLIRSEVREKGQRIENRVERIAGEESLNAKRYPLFAEPRRAEARSGSFKPKFERLEDRISPSTSGIPSIEENLLRLRNISPVAHGTEENLFHNIPHKIHDSFPQSGIPNFPGATPEELGAFFSKNEVSIHPHELKFEKEYLIPIASGEYVSPILPSASDSEILAKAKVLVRLSQVEGKILSYTEGTNNFLILKNEQTQTLTKYYIPGFSKEVQIRSIHDDSGKVLIEVQNRMYFIPFSSSEKAFFVELPPMNFGPHTQSFISSASFLNKDIVNIKSDANLGAYQMDLRKTPLKILRLPDEFFRSDLISNGIGMVSTRIGELQLYRETYSYLVIFGAESGHLSAHPVSGLSQNKVIVSPDGNKIVLLGWSNVINVVSVTPKIKVQSIILSPAESLQGDIKNFYFNSNNHLLVEISHGGKFQYYEIVLGGRGVISITIYDSRFPTFTDPILSLDEKDSFDRGNVSLTIQPQLPAGWTYSNAEFWLGKPNLALGRREFFKIPEESYSYDGQTFKWNVDFGVFNLKIKITLTSPEGKQSSIHVYRQFQVVSPSTAKPLTPLSADFYERIPSLGHRSAREIFQDYVDQLEEITGGKATVLWDTVQDYPSPPPLHIGPEGWVRLSLNGKSYLILIRTFTTSEAPWNAANPEDFPISNAALNYSITDGREGFDRIIPDEERSLFKENIFISFNNEQGKFVPVSFQRRFTEIDLENVSPERQAGQIRDVFNEVMSSIYQFGIDRYGIELLREGLKGSGYVLGQPNVLLQEQGVINYSTIVDVPVTSPDGQTETIRIQRLRVPDYYTTLTYEYRIGNESKRLASVVYYRGVYEGAIYVTQPDGEIEDVNIIETSEHEKRRHLRSVMTQLVSGNELPDLLHRYQYGVQQGLDMINQYLEPVLNLEVGPVVQVYVRDYWTIDFVFSASVDGVSSHLVVRVDNYTGRMIKVHLAPGTEPPLSAAFFKELNSGIGFNLQGADEFRRGGYYVFSGMYHGAQQLERPLSQFSSEQVREAWSQLVEGEDLLSVQYGEENIRTVRIFGVDFKIVLHNLPQWVGNFVAKGWVELLEGLPVATQNLLRQRLQNKFFYTVITSNPLIGGLPELQGEIFTKALGVAFFDGLMFSRLDDSEYVRDFFKNGDFSIEAVSRVANALAKFIHTTIHELVHGVHITSFSSDQNARLKKLFDAIVKQRFFRELPRPPYLLTNWFEYLAQIGTIFTGHSDVEWGNSPLTRYQLWKYHPESAQFAKDAFKPYLPSASYPTTTPQLLDLSEIENLLNTALSEININGFQIHAEADRSKPYRERTLWDFQNEIRQPFSFIDTIGTYGTFAIHVSDGVHGVRVGDLFASSHEFFDGDAIGHRFIISNSAGSFQVVLEYVFNDSTQEIEWVFKIEGDYKSISLFDQPNDILRMMSFSEFLESLVAPLIPETLTLPVVEPSDHGVVPPVVEPPSSVVPVPISQPPDVFQTIVITQGTSENLADVIKFLIRPKEREEQTQIHKHDVTATVPSAIPTTPSKKEVSISRFASKDLKNWLIRLKHNPSDLLNLWEEMTPQLKDKIKFLRKLVAIEVAESPSRITITIKKGQQILDVQTIELDKSQELIINPINLQLIRTLQKLNLISDQEAKELIAQIIHSMILISLTNLPLKKEEEKKGLTPKRAEVRALVDVREDIKYSGLNLSANQKTMIEQEIRRSANKITFLARASDVHGIEITIRDFKAPANWWEKIFGSKQKEEEMEFSKKRITLRLEHPFTPEQLRTKVQEFVQAIPQIIRSVGLITDQELQDYQSASAAASQIAQPSTVDQRIGTFISVPDLLVLKDGFYKANLLLDHLMAQNPLPTLQRFVIDILAGKQSFPSQLRDFYRNEIPWAEWQVGVVPTAAKQPAYIQKAWFLLRMIRILRAFLTGREAEDLRVLDEWASADGAGFIEALKNYNRFTGLILMESMVKGSQERLERIIHHERLHEVVDLLLHINFSASDPKLDSQGYLKRGLQVFLSREGGFSVLWDLFGPGLEGGHSLYTESLTGLQRGDLSFADEFWVNTIYPNDIALLPERNAAYQRFITLIDQMGRDNNDFRQGIAVVLGLKQQSDSKAHQDLQALQTLRSRAEVREKERRELFVELVDIISASGKKPMDSPKMKRVAHFVHAEVKRVGLKSFARSLRKAAPGQIKEKSTGVDKRMVEVTKDLIQHQNSVLSHEGKINPNLTLGFYFNEDDEPLTTESFIEAAFAEGVPNGLRRLVAIGNPEALRPIRKFQNRIKQAHIALTMIRNPDGIKGHGVSVPVLGKDLKEPSPNPEVVYVGVDSAGIKKESWNPVLEIGESNSQLVAAIMLLRKKQNLAQVSPLELKALIEQTSIQLFPRLKGEKILKWQIEDNPKGGVRLSININRSGFMDYIERLANELKARSEVSIAA